MIVWLNYLTVHDLEVKVGVTSSAYYTRTKFVLPPSFHQRLQDLEDHVTQDLKLLKQYEDRLRLEDEPKRITRFQQEIEQLRKSSSKYRQEWDELQQQAQEADLGNQAVESRLNQIVSDVRVLMGGQLAILGNLDQTRQALLSQYSTTQQATLAVIVDQLNQNQLLVTQTLLNALDSNQISYQQMEKMWAVLEQQIPLLPSSQTHILEVIKAPEVDIKHKLKVTLPIVPFLIDYEGELELGSGFNIKVAWEAVIAKLCRKTQSEEVSRKPIDK